MHCARCGRPLEPGRVGCVCDPTTVGARPEDVGPAEARVPGGRMLGHYHLLEALGAGAMGVVWRARDTRLGREVALKEIRRGGDDPAVRARFRREARLAARLRHPNVVAVHDAGTADGRDYLVMELVPGRPLTAVLAELRDPARSGGRDGRERLRAQVELLAQMAEGVAYAHARGVVHRDLKPANVIVDSRGRPRVTDFGLARELAPGADSLQTATGEMLGTPAYMSPEQGAGKPEQVGPPSDVYALGTMLYEMLTGQVPFPGRTGLEVILARAAGEAAPARSLNAEAPDALDAVCRVALARDPAGRYPTAREFASELRRWLAGRPVHARPPSAAERLGRALARGARLWVPPLVALGVLLAVLAHGRAREAERAEALRRALAGVAGMEHRLLAVDLPSEVRRETVAGALALVEPWVAADPGDGLARSARAHLLALLGERADAEREFDAACAAAPETAEVFLARGRWRILWYVRGRGEPPMRPGPDGPVIDVRAEEDAGQRSLRTAGLADLDRAEELAPPEGGSGVEGRTLRALAELYARGSAGAEAALAGLAGCVGAWPSKVRTIALAYAGCWEEAVAEADRVLAEWPEEAESRYRRACLLHALAGRREAQGEDPRAGLRTAVAEFSALAAAGGSASMWRRCAVVRRDLAAAETRLGGDVGAAFAAVVEDCTRWLEAAPGSAPAREMRGLAEWQLAVLDRNAGRAVEPGARAALADLAAASAAKPDDASLHEIRAELLVLLAEERTRASQDGSAELQEARGECDRAVSLLPGNARLRDQRGRVLYRLLDQRVRRRQAVNDLLGPMEADLRAAVAGGLEPSRIPLADLLAATGRCDEALALLAEGEARAPESAAAFREKAEAVRRVRDKAGGR